MAKKPKTEGVVQRVYIVVPPEVPEGTELQARLTKTAAEGIRDTVPGARIEKVFATR